MFIQCSFSFFFWTCVVATFAFSAYSFSVNKLIKTTFVEISKCLLFLFHILRLSPFISNARTNVYNEFVIISLFLCASTEKKNDFSYQRYFYFSFHFNFRLLNVKPKKCKKIKIFINFTFSFCHFEFTATWFRIQRSR